MESRFHYYVLTCIVAQIWFLRSVFSNLRASSSGILDPSAHGFGNALAEELWVEIGSPGRSGGGVEKPSFRPGISSDGDDRRIFWV